MAYKALDETQEKALNGLAYIESINGNYKESLRILLHLHDNNMENTTYMNSIGCVYSTMEDYEKADDFFKKAAEISLPKALHNYAANYLNRSCNDANLDSAKSLLQKAFDAGSLHSSLALVKICIKQNNTCKTRRYFEEAISCGVKNAEKEYGEFLRKIGAEDATLYESDDETSEENYEGLEHVKPVSHSTGFEAKGEHEAPGTQSQKRRLKKKEPTSSFDYDFIQEKSPVPSKTYKDIRIYLHSGVEKDLKGSYLTKIKRLLTALANGEKRAKFEYLKGALKGYCSMRITKGERLVFSIREGDMTTGVTSVKLIAASGHYETSPPLTDTATLYQWPKSI